MERNGQPLRRLGDPAEADEMISGEMGELPDACSLFLDVHDSTSHLQAVGDREVQRAFGELIEGIGPIILDRGGYFAELIGDAALLLFTGAHRSDRAVAAASAIQSFAVNVVGTGFRQNTGREFAIGIGLAQGDVRVRRVLPGSNGLTWLCLCTCTSAKLADLAPTGSFYVTRELFQSLTEPAADLAVAWRSDLIALKIGGVDEFIKVGTANWSRMSGQRSTGQDPG